MVENPEPKKEAKTDKPSEKPKTVEVILYPAYPKARAYCEKNQIHFADIQKRKVQGVEVSNETVRSKVRASIPETDFKALRAAQKGCVSLAA